VVRYIDSRSIARAASATTTTRSRGYHAPGTDRSLGGGQTTTAQECLMCTGSSC